VYKCDWTQQTILDVADVFVSSGLALLGYKFVNMDGCVLEQCPGGMGQELCHNYTRDAAGGLHAVDTVRLPLGVKAVCDYIHARGLLCGSYSDAGYTTCQNRPGSLFYEAQDAQMWADFGLDLWKIDNCGEVPPGWDRPETRYPRVTAALNATRRPVYFSACLWGVDQPWLWAANVSNSWRTNGDSDECDHTPGFGNGCWQHLMDISDGAVGLAKYAGPGAWNDQGACPSNGGVGW